MKALATVAIAMLLSALTAGAASSANGSEVLLLTVTPFAILAGDAITDVPTSTILGNVGLTPAAGSNYAGLTCAEVTGSIYAVNAAGPAPCVQNNPGLLTVAKNDLTTAYNDAAGRAPDTTYATPDNQLGGQSLVPGVYRFNAAATANLIGNVTLVGNADDVWIFQATSSLVFASSSTVTLTGDAQACHVFWVVGSAATLHTSASITGTILAHDDISVDGAVTVRGRLLAGGQANHAGAVTLINDTITAPTTCTTQAAIDSTRAAQAQAAATQAAANQAAANQAAADKAAADKAAADKAAADKAAADKLLADQAAAAKAAAVKAAAARTAKAAQAAATRTRLKKAAAVKAAQKRITVKRASVRAAVIRAAFTG